MDYDLALIIGLVIAGLSVPAVFSAFADGRAPRVAAISLLVGGGLILLAVSNKPGGYALSDVPDAFFSVISRYIN